MQTKLPVLLLAGIAVLFSEFAAADAVTDLKGFYANTRNLQTEFRQLQLDESGAVTQSFEGRFWMARPGKLRWVYERPYRQEMVNDGKQFWLYDEDLAQVTVRPTAQALQNAPLLLLSGGPALEKSFTLHALADAQDMQWVEIKPKDEEADFVSARIGLKQGRPNVLELQDALGQVSRILFINLRTNISIEAGRFSFIPPAGVEVVGAEQAE